MQDLESAMPELKGGMQVIVVPPSVLKLPQTPSHEDKALRDERLFDLDEVIKRIKKSRSRQDWRMLLAYGRESGLYMGPPESIIGNKSFMIDGYDTRQLGIIEYAALTIARNGQLDTSTNTMLLKGIDSSIDFPYAAREQGKIVFKIDIFGISGVFGDDRFRPTVEIE
jgi:hypothetical protein